MTNEKFTELVKDKMDSKGIKHSFVADEIGISRQAFSGKLHGVSKWTVDQVMKLCKVLDIPVDVWTQ